MAGAALPRPTPPYAVPAPATSTRVDGTVPLAGTHDDPYAELTGRLHGLGELISALSDALTVDDVVRVALCCAITLFDADRVAFGIDDGPGWRVVRRVRGELLDESEERMPPRWQHHPDGSSLPTVVTAKHGVPLFQADGQPLRDTAADRHDERIRALAALPLRTSSLRGAISFGYRDAHPWAPAERALLATTAALLSQAADRARRYEAQQGVARLLQRNMLPERLPEVPPLRLAVRYETAPDGDAGSGYFYDAFPLPGGRLGVAMGNTGGHDPRAAALTGQVRAALRALALRDRDPSLVLRGLDRLVTSLGGEDRGDEPFVTVVYGVIDTAEHRLELASAGHPAPLLRRARLGSAPQAGQIELAAGPPLGRTGGPVTSAVVDFLPGDTLLLFSDDLVRRHRPDQLAALTGAVAAARDGDPRTVCTAAAAVLTAPNGHDRAMLAVEHAVAVGRTARLEVPAEPAAPARVRRWLSNLLATWHVPEPVVGVAVLCANELATNALLHAGTEAFVEIDLNADRLVVSVTDRGTGGTVAPANAETLSGQGRGLVLIEQLSDAWGTDPTLRGSTVWFELRLPV